MTLARRTRRWLVVAACIALLLIGADRLIRQISFETFRSTLQTELSQISGRDVRIAGAMHLELFSGGQFELGEVSVAGTADRSSDSLLEVRRVWLDLDLVALLRGEIRIEDIEFVDASLFLAGRADDTPTPATTAPDLETVADPARFGVQRVRVQGLRVHYQPKGRPPIELDIDEVEFRADDPAQRVSAHGEGRVGDHSFEFSATLGPLAAKPGSNNAFPVDAHVHFSEVELDVHSIGTIELPLRPDGLKLEFNARATDGTKLLNLVYASELAVGSLKLAGHIENPAGVVGIRALHVATDVGAPFQLEVDGAVSDLSSMAGVALHAVAEAPMGVVERLFGTSLPAGTFRGEFRIADSDGSLGVEEASITIAGSDLVEIDVRGSVDDLSEIDEIGFDGTVVVPDLAALGEVFDLELPAIGPVRFEGSAVGSREKLESHGSAIVGETRLDGHWSASFATGQPRRVTAVLESQNLRLADLGFVAGSDPIDLERSTGRSVFDAWWRDGHALPVENLRELDLDIELSAERISGGGGIELKDVHAEVDSKEGELAIRTTNVGAHDQDSGLEANLTLDTRPDPPTWALRLNAHDVDLARVVTLFAADQDLVGRFDVSVDVISAGATRTAMAAALQGRVGAMLREGNLISRYARAVSLSFLRLSVPDIFKLQASADPPVQCLLIIAPIRSGVAVFDPFYLEGNRITVLGTGSMDLRNNQLEMRLTPRVHDPGLVSIAATVDVSGPLEAPVFSPERRSLGTSAARALFDNALRPFRGALRLGLGIGESADRNPCEDVSVGHPGPAGGAR